MARQTWVYPPNGGEPVLKENYHPDNVAGCAILTDLPDFVSPIDGKLYSGRAGLRTHCALHNVVPNAELKGLPTLTATGDKRSESQRRQANAARKEQIIRFVNNYR